MGPFFGFSLLFLLLGTMPLADPALLAPGAMQFREAMEKADTYVTRAEVMGRAVARIHNLAAERFVAGVEVPCDDMGLVPYLARTPILLRAWRDAAQSARVALQRVRYLSERETIAILMDERALSKVSSLEERIRTQEPAVLEALSWQVRFIDPILVRCAPPIEPGPGLPSPIPWFEEPVGEPVAVIGIGGGVVCPEAEPADGRAVLSMDGEACYGPEDCACIVSPVLPGAVLGTTSPKRLSEGEEVGPEPVVPR